MLREICGVREAVKMTGAQRKSRLLLVILLFSRENSLLLSRLTKVE